MNKYLIFIITLFLLAFTGCDGEPLLSTLSTSNTSIIFKGTYASNNPRDWWDGGAVTVEDLKDNSVENSTLEEVPDQVLVDISEIHMNGTTCFVDRFNANMDMGEDDDFFNGNGRVLASTNLEKGDNYDTAKIYFRKLMFNKGTSYDSDWVKDEDLEEDVAADTYPGYDFIYNLKFNQEDYDDDDEENLIYPYEIGFFNDFDYVVGEKLVIEIRIVIKNYVKNYEWIDDDDDIYYSYYGLGDAVTDVEAGDVFIGGNMLAAVHYYNPDEIATISGTAPSNTYVVAITEDDAIEDYIGTTSVPALATWCSDGNFELKNVPVDSKYKLYYSTNTPSAVSAEVPTGFTGEQLVEVSSEAVDTTISVSL